MKHTYHIKMRGMFWAMLGVACFAFAPVKAYSDGVDMGCSPTLANPCTGGSTGSGSSGGGYNSTPSYDYGAAQRAQQAQAAAEAERQRQQAEAERVERERRAAEKRQKDAAFIRDRDSAAGTLKGSSGSAMNQLKGISGADSSGLKGSGFDTGSAGLKGLQGSGSVVDSRNEPAGLGGKSNYKGTTAKPSKHAPHTDTSVVDARNVPSGLPKSVDNAIASHYADAPPGVSDRVRKGFQAVMERDWKVAKAWFQDALNRDPTNIGLKRMLALTETPRQTSQQHSAAGNLSKPTGQLQLPDPNDIYLMFPGSEQSPPKAEPTGAPRMFSPEDVYVHIPTKGYNRVSRDEALMMDIWADAFGVPRYEQSPVSQNFPLEP